MSTDNEHEPQGGEPPTPDFRQWAGQVREKQEAAGPPPLPPRGANPLKRWVVSAVILVAVAALATVALRQIMPEPVAEVTGTVRGVVLNAQGKPLANAWIFLASAPQVECR